MVFLRPQFLYVFAALFLFFILKSFFEETKAKTNRKITVLMAVQTVLILVYCANFKTAYGIFSLSDAMPRQNLITCMQMGYYKEFENEEMAQMLDKFVDGGTVDWTGYDLAVEKYGNAEIAIQTKKYFQQHLTQYICDTANVMLADAYTVFDGYDYRPYDAMRPDLSENARKILRIQGIVFNRLTIGLVLVIVLFEGVSMICVWITERRPPWVHMALFSISMCTTYLTYFLTCGEYMRTMISVLPYFCIMCGMFIQWIYGLLRTKK